MADYGIAGAIHRESDREDKMICHDCGIEFFPEEVEFYDPLEDRVSSDFYAIGDKGYGCPLCDTPLDEENMKEFKNAQPQRQASI